MNSKRFKIYSDGGSRGNPGPAAIGAVVTDLDTNEVLEISDYIGETTNNQAEYKALIMALEKVKELGGVEIECYLDSELVVKQLNGQYKVKDVGLGPLFIKIHNIRQGFKKIHFHHVPRSLNKEADRLVNEVLDNR